MYISAISDRTSSAGLGQDWPQLGHFIAPSSAQKHFSLFLPEIRGSASYLQKSL
jgi:hypothetical protein